MDTTAKSPEKLIDLKTVSLGNTESRKPVKVEDNIDETVKLKLV